MRLILLCLLVPYSSAEDFDSGFKDADFRRDGVVGAVGVPSRVVGLIKLDFQIRKTKPFVYFCIRMLVPIRKKRKYIDGCLGMEIKRKNGIGDTLEFMLRTGKRAARFTVTRTEAETLRKCFETHILLGEICVSGLSWDHDMRAVPSCSGPRDKFCATIASIKFGVAANSCAIFCDDKLSKYKREWTKWEQTEDGPMAY